MMQQPSCVSNGGTDEAQLPLCQRRRCREGRTVGQLSWPELLLTALLFLVLTETA